MPNWTENEVRFISKNKSSLTKLKKKLEGKEKLRELPSGKWTTVKNVFDFNKIIPMPLKADTIKTARSLIPNIK